MRIYKSIKITNYLNNNQFKIYRFKLQILYTIIMYFIQKQYFLCDPVSLLKKMKEKKM